MNIIKLVQSIRLQLRNYFYTINICESHIIYLKILEKTKMKNYMNLIKEINSECHFCEKLKRNTVKIFDNILNSSLFYNFKTKPSYNVESDESILFIWENILIVHFTCKFKSNEINCDVFCEIVFENIFKTFELNKQREVKNVSNIIINLIKFMES